MPRNIRTDMVGVVSAFRLSGDGHPAGSAYALEAGATVPSGVYVPDHLLEPLPGTFPAGERPGHFDPLLATVDNVNSYLGFGRDIYTTDASWNAAIATERARSMPGGTNYELARLLATPRTSDAEIRRVMAVEAAGPARPGIMTGPWASYAPH